MIYLASELKSVANREKSADNKEATTLELDCQIVITNSIFRHILQRFILYCVPKYKNRKKMEKQLVERFIRYIKVDTTSDPRSELHPSTSTQLDFSKALAEELKEIGLSDVSVDDKAYVMASLPSNIDYNVPVIGFIAHIDTSPDFTGKNIQPQFIENYNGEKIILNSELGIELDPEMFPELLKYKGQTLITTDGTTLLSADDKAGVAEIVTAMEYLIKHPEMPHGEIRVGFTPEIGRAHV